MNNPKGKFKNSSIYNSITKNYILKIKLLHRFKTLVQIRTTKKLMKVLKKTQINGKTSHVHGLEDLILLRCQYYTKWSTDLMQSLSKSQQHFFKEQKKSNLKFIWSLKGPWIAKTILKKKTKLEDSYFLISKLQSYNN